MSHTALEILGSAILVSAVPCVAGCGSAAFGGALAGYDQPGCIENALRNGAPADLIAPARERFTAACRAGEAESCSALGVMNELGLGMAVDHARAASLYRKACIADYGRGCVNLGLALERGAGVARDVKQAETLFAKACAVDVMSGCAELGRIELGREGKAHHGSVLLERACKAHERAACVAFGDALARRGEHREALVAYTKACLHGDRTACDRMDGPSIRTSGDAAAAWRSK